MPNHPFKPGVCRDCGRQLKDPIHDCFPDPLGGISWEELVDGIFDRTKVFAVFVGGCMDGERRFLRREDHDAWRPVLAPVPVPWESIWMNDTDDAILDSQLIIDRYEFTGQIVWGLHVYRCRGRS